MNTETQALLIGRKADTYYPASKHFCFHGTITEIKGWKVRVKCDEFPSLEEWFDAQNIHLLPAHKTYE